MKFDLFVKKFSNSQGEHELLLFQLREKLLENNKNSENSRKIKLKDCCEPCRTSIMKHSCGNSLWLKVVKYSL